jgi:hypothetical protein
MNPRIPILCLVISTVAAFFLALGGTRSLVGQPKSENLCEIHAISPAEGDPVGADGPVSGTATIPNGAFLWVLAHRKNIKAWWPQGNGPADIDSKTHRFDVFTTYGQDRDHGAFEVALAVVDPETNEILTKWFDTAQARGYPPVPFPSTHTGCPVIKITVMKR